MKKLYEVELTYTVFVLAEDPVTADEVAIDSVRGANEEPDGSFVHAIDDIRNVPDSWKDAVPFNTEDGRSIRELLKPNKL